MPNNMGVMEICLVILQECTISSWLLLDIRSQISPKSKPNFQHAEIKGYFCAHIEALLWISGPTDLYMNWYDNLPTEHTISRCWCMPVVSSQR